MREDDYKDKPDNERYFIYLELVDNISNIYWIYTQCIWKDLMNS
jgi:hypothetical protein